MGAWGTGLFDTDLACDLRDDFSDFVGEGLTAEEATVKTLELHGEALSDPEEGPVGIVALAVTQWKLGRLQPDILERAVAAIDAGADLDNWGEPASRRGRAKVLAAIRGQLLSTMPPPKRVPRRKRSSSPFMSGQVIVYHHPDRPIVLWVLGSWEDRGGTYSTVEILGISFGVVREHIDLIVHAPSIAVPYDPESFEGLSLNPWVDLLGVQDLPPERWELMGSIPYPPERQLLQPATIFAFPGARQTHLHEERLDAHIDRLLAEGLL